jgi:limonene 1,2-monooxygenase
MNLRFGTFMAPFHASGENPTVALERDLELVERMDELGFDEAWFGEHHSAGFEIIASPELFCAFAAARTRRIKLGTGVMSLPYQHPFMVADKVVQLDHMTRGRFMLGCGPGALASDALMMGHSTAELRPRMEQALEAILHLLTSDEPLSMKTDWFELHDARLQLAPFTRPRPEVVVAATASPSGPRAAGRFGVGVLSISAASDAGFQALSSHRRIWQERAEEFDQPFLIDQWRLVAPLHIAETRAEAERDIRFGLTRWVDYFSKTLLNQYLPAERDPDKLVSAINESGMAAIGTPDDAIALIERLVEESEGFGTFLVLAHDWANREATLRSYELLARYVMPAFQGSAERAVRSHAWCTENMEYFMGQAWAGMRQAFEQHSAEHPETRPTL